MLPTEDHAILLTYYPTDDICCWMHKESVDRKIIFLNYIF